jgi:hypothetical protein
METFKALHASSTLRFVLAQLALAMSFAMLILVVLGVI